MHPESETVQGWPGKISLKNAVLYNQKDMVIWHMVYCLLQIQKDVFSSE